MKYTAFHFYFTEKRITDVCSNTRYVTRSTYIASPGFPENYPPGVNCRCIVSSAPSSRVKLEIVYLAVKYTSPCKDWLQVCKYSHLLLAALMPKFDKATWPFLKIDNLHDIKWQKTNFNSWSRQKDNTSSTIWQSDMSVSSIWQSDMTLDLSDSCQVLKWQIDIGTPPPHPLPLGPQLLIIPIVMILVLLFNINDRVRLCMSHNEWQWARGVCVLWTQRSVISVLFRIDN